MSEIGPRSARDRPVPREHRRGLLGRNVRGAEDGERGDVQRLRDGGPHACTRAEGAEQSRAVWAAAAAEHRRELVRQMLCEARGLARGACRRARRRARRTTRTTAAAERSRKPHLPVQLAKGAHGQRGEGWLELGERWQLASAEGLEQASRCRISQCLRAAVRGRRAARPRLAKRPGAVVDLGRISAILVDYVRGRRRRRRG